MPLLTIAFPTYKRPHRIIESISDTLSNKSQDIEVIVCDNSEDYLTKEILANIDDKRFSYYRNGKNLGFCGNFKQCIMNANGEFTLIVSDEDRINHAALNDILDIIKSQNIAYRGGQQQESKSLESKSLESKTKDSQIPQSNTPESQESKPTQSTPNAITEIISGVAYIDEIDRYYVAPPKNKNVHLSPNQTKSHPLYKMLRSYVSGFCFNTKIAKYIYQHRISPFVDGETYFYYPFWVVGWLSLEFGGAYTYNSKPLIFKTQNDNSSYIEMGEKKAQKVFSFASEIRCFEDKIKLSINDNLLIQSSLDAYNLYYIQNTTLKNDTSISWVEARKRLFGVLKENRKYPLFSIMHFYCFKAQLKFKKIIKKLIRYKPIYKT
ncbi:glycosyltransferase [Helicobacter sp. 16-1353]|uniref:glycosyltransferase family 2 protein n=1 Tax=Helicobacter sp. 16-1353 TaxID=2004996 RepID=UPI0015EF3496|nr:glycosyltransferase [Helicobacter sp. 16-1353]